jgi:hypothetical protein
MRAPLAATVLLTGGAMGWSWIFRGYAYLGAFALMGAGELGGAYFPNYMISISPLADGPRNLSILTLATLGASAGATAHGVLTDLFGFWTSFLFGISTALAALWLVLKLPSVRPRIESND